MRYTVCSHGRPIGVTDLGFFHIKGLARAGWFHPNADGEKVMPLVTSMHRALRAYGSRNLVGEEGTSLVHSDFIGSQVYADIAEALHRLESLGLSLHREDGSLVPTALIGLQDCEELLADPRDFDSWIDEIDAQSWLEDIDSDPDHCLDDLEQSCDDDPEEAFAELIAPIDPWVPDVEPVQHPRYQIIVNFIDDDTMIP